MKRNTLFASAFLLGALALTACSNEESVVSENAANSSREIIISASMGADTRTWVTLPSGGGGDTEYKTNWSDGDQIYIWGYKTVNGSTEHVTPNAFNPYVYATLEIIPVSGGDATMGTFKGFVSGSGSQTNLQYALYPEPERIVSVSEVQELFSDKLLNEGGSGNENKKLEQAFGYSFPNSYTYSQEGIATNVPMYATFNDMSSYDANNPITLQFNNICSMIRIRLDYNSLFKGLISNAKIVTNENLNNATLTIKDVVLTADKTITGNSAVAFVYDSNKSEGQDYQKVDVYLKMTKEGLPLRSVTYSFTDVTYQDNGSGTECVLDFPVPTGEITLANVVMNYTITATVEGTQTSQDYAATLYSGKACPKNADMTVDGKGLVAGDLWELMPQSTGITIEADGATYNKVVD